MDTELAVKPEPMWLVEDEEVVSEVKCVKAMKLRQTKSGQAATSMKSPKYTKKLSFLTPLLFDKEGRVSNISSPSESDILPQDLDEDAIEVVTCTSEIPCDTPAATPSGTGKKRARSSLEEGESVVSVFKNYLEAKKERRDSLTNFFVNMARL